LFEPRQVPKIETQWLINLFGIKWDLLALFRVVQIFVLAMLAYNIGIHDAWEQVKFAAYTSTTPIYQTQNMTGLYELRCVPNASKTDPTVRWDCREAMAGLPQKTYFDDNRTWTKANLTYGWG